MEIVIEIKYSLSRFARRLETHFRIQLRELWYDRYHDVDSELLWNEYSVSK